MGGVGQILHLDDSSFKDQAVDAFQTFRKGVVAAGSCKEVDPDVLFGGLCNVSGVSSKHVILRFLARLHDEKKLYKKQVIAVIQVLLQVRSWLDAVRDNEELVQLLPPEASAAELLEAAVQADVEAAAARAASPPALRGDAAPETKDGPSPSRPSVGRQFTQAHGVGGTDAVRRECLDEHPNKRTSISTPIETLESAPVRRKSISLSYCRFNTNADAVLQDAPGRRKSTSDTIQKVPKVTNSSKVFSGAVWSLRWSVCLICAIYLIWLECKQVLPLNRPEPPKPDYAKRMAVFLGM